MVRRTDKSALQQQAVSPRGSMVNPAMALSSMFQVSLSGPPSRSSLSSGAELSHDGPLHESSSSSYRNSASSRERSMASLSMRSSMMSSSKSPSPAFTNTFSVEEGARKAVVSATPLELWMIAWIREYLEVEPDYIDLFQLSLPEQDVGSTSSKGVTLLVCMLMSLEDFRCSCCAVRWTSC